MELRTYGMSTGLSGARKPQATSFWMEQRTTLMVLRVSLPVVLVAVAGFMVALFMADSRAPTGAQGFHFPAWPEIAFASAVIVAAHFAWRLLDHVFGVGRHEQQRILALKGAEHAVVRLRESLKALEKRS
jgi:hypothetical protein